MIIQNVIGNIATLEKKAPHVERVYMNSDDLVKRIQRVTTDHGNELGIRLKENRELHDGDILYMDEKNVIIVAVKDDDILTIMPKSIKQMGEIAHQLGNRHLPAQFEGNEMLVQYDYLVENMLQEQSIPYKREKRKVKQAFRHIGHRHD
ncbi:urease accessory protein UreE [Bacillota bacterium Lsc_1132]